MLKRVEVRNFMSLKDASIELSPLTVFIGPNASGKSATFKALVVLSRLLSSPVRSEHGSFTLDEGVTLDDLVWSGNSGLPIGFKVWLDDNNGTDPDYSLELSKGAAGWGVSRETYKIGDDLIERDEATPFEFGTERRGTVRANTTSTLKYLAWRYRYDSVAQPTIAPILALADRVGEVWRYRPSADDIARFVRPRAEGRDVTVGANGSGLAYVLQKLQGEDRSTFTKIEQDLSKLFPHIRTIGFKSDYQGVRLTYMTDRSEDPIPAPQEADGVLLSTFLLWRLHTAPSGLCVCLEEPENGIHIRLLKNRVDLLRSFSRPADAHRPPLQILVATQSKELANFLMDDDYPSIRLVNFDKDKGTSAVSGTWHEASRMVDRL